jgi:hypothetical protein
MLIYLYLFFILGIMYNVGKVWNIYMMNVSYLMSFQTAVNLAPESTLRYVVWEEYCPVELLIQPLSH